MASLRTTNNAARRAMKRQVVETGRDFHRSQVERMWASDTLHKLRDTRYARRQRAISLNSARNTRAAARPGG